MNKEVCEICRKKVSYHLITKEEKALIKGKEYSYLKKVAICNNCNNEVDVDSLIDENLNMLDSVYRKTENIITVEEIEKILEKYNIGKKPLSKLLGWGEVTITRYINGDIPTKPYSEELIKLLNDSNYMKILLEKNRENVTVLAYNNILNSINNKNYVMKDIEIIVQYLIDSCVEVTPLALQKILYYSQGFYSVFFQKNLFNDDCEAWVHGPVYVDIYNKYKEFAYTIIEQHYNEDITDFLDEDKKTLLDVIAKSFGYYNGKALEMMTHFEDPWINARQSIPVNEKSNKIISKNEIRVYFEKVKESFNMINILDIKKYSESQFRRVCEYK